MGYAVAQAVREAGAEVLLISGPAFTSRPTLIGPGRQAVERLIKRLAPQYALDPALVKRVVAAESAYRIDARSSKNALGLMQLIPAAAARFWRAKHLGRRADLRGDMAYLSWLLGQFRGDVRLALAGSRPVKAPLPVTAACRRMLKPASTWPASSAATARLSIRMRWRPTDGRRGQNLVASRGRCGKR